MKHIAEDGSIMEIEQMGDGHLYNSINKQIRLYRCSKNKDVNLFKKTISYYVLDALIRNMDIVNLLNSIRKEIINKGERMKFTKMTSDEYLNSSSHSLCGLTFKYEDIVRVIGEPFNSEDENYPDDDYKTDICWGIKDDNNDFILIWNYKNGNNYCQDRTLVEELDYFYVYYTNIDFYYKLLDEIQKGLENNG